MFFLYLQEYKPVLIILFVRHMAFFVVSHIALMDILSYHVSVLCMFYSSSADTEVI